MNRYRMTLALLPILVAGCATTQQPPPVTTVTLQHAHVEKVQSIFAMGCSNIGGRIVSQTANALECAKPMGNSFKETLYKAAATEQYASNPDFHFQWSYFQTDSGVVINSTEWIEHQNAFGKTTRDSINGGDASAVLVAVQKAWLASPAYQQASQPVQSTQATTAPRQPTEADAMNTELRRLASDAQSHGDSKAAKEYLDMIVPASSQH